MAKENILNREPTIIINGTLLTNAQAISVRVAVGNFQMDLESRGLGDDYHGKTMTKLYGQRLSEINEIMQGDENE